MEIGPQPHGVVRSNIYTTMKYGVQHMLDWVRFYNSGATQLQDDSQVLQTLCFFVVSRLWLDLNLFPGTVFEGGFVDVYTMVKNIDYPRDSETRNITAAIHPQLQVQSEMCSHFVIY